MEFSFNLLKYFEKVVLDASESIELFDDSFEVQIRVADERFGDFQANGVLPYAKRKGMNPRDLAQSIIDALPQNKLWDSSIAGPGFINFKLNSESLLIWMNGFSDLEDLKGLLKTDLPQRITLDFSGPNTAKQMHVGHIRSTIIGESLARLLELQGHHVTRDNHLGDWGTQFGILLYAIKREEISLDELVDDPVATLEDLYRKGNAWTKENEIALDEARNELVKLQKTDTRTPH